MLIHNQRIYKWENGILTTVKLCDFLLKHHRSLSPFDYSMSLGKLSCECNLFLLPENIEDVEFVTASKERELQLHKIAYASYDRDGNGLPKFLIRFPHYIVSKRVVIDGRLEWSMQF